jgi:hypothetical protein
MRAFLEREKSQQALFKRTAPYFSLAARADGLYGARPRPFCLPVERAEENLYPEIRQAAPAHFHAHGIKWHAGHDGKPSNHLCDSQVCCVNFLFPFAHRPDALATVLRPLFPTLRRMLPVEDGHYVTFEWIGHNNYLGEKVPRSGTRTRGANCTSADAAVLFERTDGTRQVVLIEWKYTEAYAPTPLRIAKSGTDRANTYQRHFDQADCPLNKGLVPTFEALFFEPFYQFMRQQFLAHEMEKAKELGASTVSVLHIAPAHNTDFRRITSLSLAALGETPTAIWTRLVRLPDRFLSVNTEHVFGSLSVAQLPDMGSWLEYIGARYPWVRAGKAPALPNDQRGN